MRLSLPAGAYPGKYLKVEYHLQAPRMKASPRSKSPRMFGNKNSEVGHVQCAVVIDSLLTAERK